VDRADLTVRPGSVHCLIGPNGAGKSTLLDVLSGFSLPSGGTWRIATEGGDTRDVTGRRPWQLARLGLRRKFQAPAVSPSLSVARNIAVATSSSPRLRDLVSDRRSVEITPECAALLDAGGLRDVLDTPAGHLSHGQRQ